MTEKAFQDFYPEYFAHCYGCGSMNDLGHQIKSFWDGDESVCRFQPKTYHTAIPGYVYGGLLASLVDCHGTGTRRESRHGYRAAITLSNRLFACRLSQAHAAGSRVGGPREGEGSQGTQSGDRRMDCCEWCDYCTWGSGRRAGAREFGGRVIKEVGHVSNVTYFQLLEILPHRLEIEILPTSFIILRLTFGDIGMFERQFCFTVTFFQ
jgi:hypothetical protein